MVDVEKNTYVKDIEYVIDISIDILLEDATIMDVEDIKSVIK